MSGRYGYLVSPRHAIFAEVASHARPPSLLNIVAAVTAEPPEHKVPDEANVKLNDPISTACPAHVFAVWKEYCDPLRLRRKTVTLYAVHSLIFASYCNNLPALRDRSKTRAKPSAINLPVVPLPLPLPDMFAMLVQYLYTKSLHTLFSRIRPAANTPIEPNMPFSVKKRSAELGRMPNVGTLLRYAMIIGSLWRNARALGVLDDGLWDAINLSWASIIGAIAIITEESH